MSVYYIERTDGRCQLRFNDFTGEIDSWRIGIFRAFDRLDDAERLCERFRSGGYDCVVRVCHNPLTCEPGTKTLDAESSERARREFFTASRDDMPIRLRCPAMISMLSTCFVVVIGNDAHYSGVLRHDEVSSESQHSTSQPELF